MRNVAFVPIKLNSERFPLKNIKPFTNGKPLIHYILSTLLKVKELDEIYVFCSSDEITKYIPEGVKFLKRDTYFDLSSTSFNEVLQGFAKAVDADNYVLTHATAPFMSKESISLGLQKVNSGEYDSALSVCALQEFIWKDGKPFNYELEKIPRTQDLDLLYTETCGLYIYSKDLILNKGRRIGNKPFLIPVTKFEACDINTADDFAMADAIFNYKLLNGDFDE